MFSVLALSVSGNASLYLPPLLPLLIHSLIDGIVNGICFLVIFIVGSGWEEAPSVAFKLSSEAKKENQKITKLQDLMAKLSKNCFCDIIYITRFESNTGHQFSKSFYPSRSPTYLPSGSSNWFNRTRNNDCSWEIQYILHCTQLRLVLNASDHVTSISSKNSNLGIATWVSNISYYNRNGSASFFTRKKLCTILKQQQWTWYLIPNQFTQCNI